MDRGRNVCPRHGTGDRQALSRSLPAIGDWGLGIGMLAVSEGGHVNVIVSSVSPMPRTNPKRRSRLVREHQRRVIPPSGVARVRLL